MVFQCPNLIVSAVDGYSHSGVLSKIELEY